MPTIPNYQRSNVTTEPQQQLATPSTPGLEAFGGGAALAGFQGARNLAGAAGEVIEQQKKQADDVMSQNAYAQALKEKNTLLYDPTSGAMTQKGANAIGTADKYRAEFDSRMDNIANSLQNDDQRNLFLKIRSRVGEDLGGVLERHVYDQSQKYQSEVEKSTMKAALDDATLNYFQPGKIDEAVTIVRDLARKQAAAQGLQDISAEKEKEATSQVYASVLDRMLATKDPGARGFYLARQGDFTAEDRERLDKTMQTATTVQEASRNADQITGQYRDLGAAMKAARALPPGEVRDQTLNRVKDFFADQKLAEDERDRNRMDGAAEMILKSGGQAELTPQQLSGLKPAQIRELHEFRRQTLQGESAPQNSDAYLSLLQMSATDPAKFNQVSLGDYRSKIAPGQLSELAKAQNASKAGESNPDVAGARGLQALITGNVQSMGLRTKEDGDQIKAYTDEVFRRVHNKRIELGRKLTDDEAQSIADSMATPVTVVNRFWNSSTRLFAAPTDKSLKITVDDIPPQEMRKIREALVIEGKPYSDDAALLKYQLKIGQYRGR